MGCYQSAQRTASQDEAEYQAELRKHRTVSEDRTPLKLTLKKFSERHRAQSPRQAAQPAATSAPADGCSTSPAHASAVAAAHGQPASPSRVARVGALAATNGAPNPYGSIGNGWVPRKGSPLAAPLSPRSAPSGNPYGSVGSDSVAPNGHGSAGGASVGPNPYGSVGSGGGSGSAGQTQTSTGNPYGSVGSGTQPHARLALGTAAAARRAVTSAFEFSGLQDASVCKLPGSIEGQGFSISDCRGCDIYLLDRCGQVQIDDCADCCVLVGPTDGSIFVRDCRNCKLILSCRQFRARNVKSCDVMLHCRTKPIIEASQNVGFCCWHAGYKGYMEQLGACQMSVFQNFWSSIHDFTPSACSWHITEETCCDLTWFRREKPHGVQALLDYTADTCGVCTTGETPKMNLMCVNGIGSNFLFVLMTAAALRQQGGDGGDGDALAQLKHVSGLSTVQRTNKTTLTRAQAEEMVANATGWGSASALCDQECYGFELASGDLAAVERKATRCGFLCSESEAAAGVFRFAGLTG